MSKKYTKLESGKEYDKEKVEELADALNEARELRSRLEYLKELANEHSDLHEHLWTTVGGEVISHHKIEDDHLKNIMTHCLKMGRRIPKGIKSEARERGFEVPTEDSSSLYISGPSSEAYRSYIAHEGEYDEEGRVLHGEIS